MNYKFKDNIYFSPLLESYIPSSLIIPENLLTDNSYRDLLKKIDKKQDFIIYKLCRQNKKLEWIIYFNVAIFFGIIITYFIKIFIIF